MPLTFPRCWKVPKRSNLPTSHIAASLKAVGWNCRNCVFRRRGRCKAPAASKWHLKAANRLSPTLLEGTALAWSGRHGPRSNQLAETGRAHRPARARPRTGPRPRPCCFELERDVVALLQSTIARLRPSSFVCQLCVWCHSGQPSCTLGSFSHNRFALCRRWIARSRGRDERRCSSSRRRRASSVNCKRRDAAAVSLYRSDRRREGLMHELVGDRSVPEPRAGASRAAAAGACASWLASRVVAFPLCLYLADDGLRSEEHTSELQSLRHLV